MEALHQTDLERLRPVLARYELEGTEVSLVSSNCSNCTGYKVVTNAGDVYVTEIPKQQVGLLSLERRFQQLHDYNYAAMPRYYSTPANRFVTVLGLKKYIVAEWVDGVPISLLQEENEENFNQLGRNLARLHQIPHPTRSQLRQPSEVRMLMGEHGRELLFNFRAQQLFTNAVKNPVLTHSAVRPENVIVAGNRVVMVNWDRVGPGCSYAEVAQTLQNTAVCNTDSMQSFLSGYEEVKPLLPEDKQLIFGFFSFPNQSRHMMRKVERTPLWEVSADQYRDTARLQQATKWLRSWSGW